MADMTTTHPKRPYVTTVQVRAQDVRPGDVVLSTYAADQGGWGHVHSVEQPRVRPGAILIHLVDDYPVWMIISKLDELISVQVEHPGD